VPVVSHVGFWWNVLYSPFRNFSEVAAQFFATRKDREKYKTFVNLWLAEVWKEIVEAKNESSILQLRTSRPEIEVPEGALGLTAGIDNQRRGCWVSIWAWVRRETGVIEQHLVRYGYVGDFTELGIWLFQDIYTTKSGVICPIRRGGMDIGGGEGESGDASMTEQVYQWLRLFGQGCIFGVKGSSRLLAGGKKIQVSLIDKMPGKGRPIPGGLKLLILDTNALKDAFWSRVEAGQVHLHAGTEDRFASHLAAEAKERDRRGREVWVQQGNRPNHLLDTVIYASAVADPECWGGAQVWRPLPIGNQAAAMAEPEQVNPFTGQKQGDWLRR
jgi:phage terminase large subunit GpA-like protein